MNILIGCFADVRKPGGAATTSRILGAELIKKGHRVAILSKTVDINLREREKTNGIDTIFYKANSGIFWRTPFFVIEKRIAKFMENHCSKPDILLAISPFYINAARKIWHDTKIIFIFPCLLSECLKFYPDALGNYPYKFLNTILLNHAEKKALSNCDAAIIPSYAILKQVLSFNALNNKRFTVCHFGVTDLKQNISEDRESVRSLFKTPQSATVILSVGILDKNKNIKVIINAFASLLINNKINNIYLWIAGAGPSENDLKKEADILKVSDNVLFLGAQAKIQNIYNAVDLYVHAAYYDAFPNVYLEALVSGLPVIGPRNEPGRVTSSLGEIIEDGKQGYLYSLDKPGELVQHMVGLIEDENKRKTMGKAARERALTHFRWDNYINKIEELLKK